MTWHNFEIKNDGNWTTVTAFLYGKPYSIDILKHDDKVIFTGDTLNIDNVYVSNCVTELKINGKPVQFHRPDVPYESGHSIANNKPRFENKDLMIDLKRMID